VMGSKTTSYVYLGDRWHGRNLQDSRYIWMPLQVGDRTLSLPPDKPWTIDTRTGISTPPAP